MFAYDSRFFKNESDVEIKYILPLLTQILGYDEQKDLFWKESIDFVQGREKVRKQADLVVYKENKPVLLVEAKSPKESCKDNVAQTDSYAFAKEVRYSLTINGLRLILREYLAGNKKINLLDESIQTLHNNNYKELISSISKANINTQIIESKEPTENKIELNKIKDYRQFFRSIHNIIRDSEKIDPVIAFDNFSKILYLILANEMALKDKSIEHFESLEDFKTPSAKPIDLLNDWFCKAMNKYYPNIFGENARIDLGFETIQKIFTKIKQYDFLIYDTSIDIKGRAFEEFLPSQLRGKGLGQFFTPRSIVKFMVALSDISHKDIILDFACGSGGFLIESFHILKKMLDEIPESSFHAIGTTKENTLGQIKQKQIFGIDAESKAVRIAKMNMFLWGDGDQIVRGNGLSSLDWYGNPYKVTEYDSLNDSGGCTLILANPPFGLNEKDSTILQSFEIAKNKTSLSTQNLFIEKGIRLLRPSGRMLIVLPEGILSNPNDSFVRNFIYKNARIRAVIALPKHTFVQSGVDTINSVILYIEKYENGIFEQIRKHTKDMESEKEIINAISEIVDYEIFLGTCQNVGFEPNGKILKQEKSDLDILLEHYFDTSHTQNATKPLFEENEDSTSSWKKYAADSHTIKFSSIQERLDPSFYLFFKNYGAILQNFKPLESFGLEIKDTKIKRPKQDYELESEYELYSVNKNSPDWNMEFDGYIFGDELARQTQSKIKLYKNYIVYNPYRANIGSFALVPTNIGDNAIASGAYIQFCIKNYESEILLYLFKTPFYQKYIKILSTGSIRDNFSKELLRQIKVPLLDSKTKEKLLQAARELKENEQKLKLLNKIIIKQSYKDIFM
ncbi:N-6 DNA methylase [Helicobacter pullorum NCTC 12824]|uniref:N-6 DNA methylase n=1 Tax=Helicobacter pullorum TaxID=35818 RepID=UPI001248EFCF|nr:N-6 DNA methylase [Helicobacter pullorum]KAB0576119.1 N-6 DNA methylase [Helicobacter pullorum NCTC 12824]